MSELPGVFVGGSLMREILFRGRNKHSREWEFGCYYKQTEFYGDEIEDHVIITSHEELSYDQAHNHCAKMDGDGNGF
jgi:hypothetical protein